MIGKRIKTYFISVIYLFNYPLFAISIGFLMGCIFADIFKIKHLSDSTYIFFVSYLLITLIIKFNKKKRNLLLVLIFFVLGIWRSDKFFSHDSSFVENYIGHEVTISGEVKFDAEFDDINSKAILKVDKLIFENKEIKSKGNILLKLPRYPVYYYGDKLEIRGLLEAPENFDDFDYQEYLATKDVFSLMKPYYTNKLGEINNVYSRLGDFKHSLSTKIKSSLPEPHASLFLGILIGTKESMPLSFENSLSSTSTTHIISVSGYNINVILAAIMGFAGKIPRKLTVWFAYVLLTLFMIIVGFNNLPALRAGVVGYAFLTSMVIGKRGGVQSFLPLSAAIIMFLNPLSFKSLSFQLSYAATLGLIFYSDFFDSKLKKLPEIIRVELTPTLAATISTLPITLSNFGKLAILSPLVNVLVLPIVPMIMTISFFYSILSFISIRVASIFSFAPYLLINYLVEVISYFGKFKFVSLDLGKVNNWIILIILSFLIILALNLNTAKYEKD